MIKFLTAIALVLFCTNAAEAKHYAKHEGSYLCTPTNDNMRPCAYNPNPFSGARSFTVKMHRVAARVKKQHRTLVAYAPANRQDKEITHKQSVEPDLNGNGIVKSASGAKAYVAARATKAFQCIVNSLEEAGYKITEMGGFANSGHIRHSLHYSGLALDINQLSRNVTKPRMPVNEIQLAHSCGLISGAQWAGSPDSGHFQFGGWAGYGKTQYASHYRHVRYAYHRHRSRKYANL